MSTVFWAGYISGAAGIIVGNPLDLIKVRLQAGSPLSGYTTQFVSTSSLVRGATAPLLGYGALNALLFVTYKRTVVLLNNFQPPDTILWKTWAAGAVAGLATWVVSTPTELIKCRAQFSSSNNSISIVREILRSEGFRGLYFGGAVTALRDSIGYGFYFWSYELSMRLLANRSEETERVPLGAEAGKVLLCGGLAGVVTWASIFPLDVIKTRVQTQLLPSHNQNDTEAGQLIRSQPSRSLTGTEGASSTCRIGAMEVARKTYREGGIAAFFRGLTICSVRAFVVNAVQWAVYEWIMRKLEQSQI